MIKLSILICSLEERKLHLNYLLEFLNKQKTDEVEILTEIDNGEISIGKKRNLLLQRATGEYIVFIDDDDGVSNDYVPKILDALKEDVDCCGIEGIITFNGKGPKRFIHSLKYDKWFEDENAYYRCPNHLNPTKTEIARKIGYTAVRWAEDFDYSLRIRGSLKTECYIDKCIYYYLFNNTK